jgi:hypothetical protein
MQIWRAEHLKNTNLASKQDADFASKILGYKILPWLASKHKLG